MKPMRSSASVQLRRDVAQLLRRLRAVRRQKRPYDQLQWRLHRALEEARSIGRLVSFSDAPLEQADAPQPGTCPVGGPSAGREKSDAPGRGTVAADCA
jgi:hypothetical protein